METRRSPWWYRSRAAVIGCMYFAAFLLSPLLGRSGWAEPAAVTFGRYFGNGGSGAMVWVAVAAIVTSWLIRTWGSAYLRPATVWNADALTDRLIVDGPFRYVRNPLYLGNVLLGIGFGLFASLPGFLFLVIANTAFVFALIAEESTSMRARYGATFDRFVATVPALVPRLTAADVPHTPHAAPSLLAGLRSEVFVGGLAIGAVILAAEGERGVPIFYALSIVAYAARILITRSEMRKRRV